MNSQPREQKNNQSFCLVITTLDSKESARRLAEKLVKKRLAGCVTVQAPALSFYRWKGKVEKAEETLLLIKTGTEKYPEVEEFIKQEHSYDCPEIIAVPLLAGEPEYLGWLKNSLK